MPLTCKWGDTPAYQRLEPVYAEIEAAHESVDWSNSRVWANYPTVLPLLDSLITGAGTGGFFPPIASILMTVDQSHIGPDNAAEVWGRMRAYEELSETTVVTCFGDYDEDTDTYTVDEDHKARPLPRALFDQCMNYSANVSNVSRREWIKRMRKHDEDGMGRFTAKYVNAVVDKYAAEYAQKED